MVCAPLRAGGSLKEIICLPAWVGAARCSKLRVALPDAVVATMLLLILLPPPLLLMLLLLCQLDFGCSCCWRWCCSCCCRRCLFVLLLLLLLLLQPAWWCYWLLVASVGRFFRTHAWQMCLSRMSPASAHVQANWLSVSPVLLSCDWQRPSLCLRNAGRCGSACGYS